MSFCLRLLVSKLDRYFFYQKIFLFKVWKVKLFYCFNILIQELRYGEQDMPSNPRKIGTCIMTAILIFWNWLLIWKIYNILWVRCLSHSPEPKLNNIKRHIKCKNESVSDILDSKYQDFLCQHFLYIINYIWCIIIWISW